MPIKPKSQLCQICFFFAISLMFFILYILSDQQDAVNRGLKIEEGKRNQMSLFPGRPLLNNGVINIYCLIVVSILSARNLCSIHSMYEAVLDHPGDYFCQAQAQISLILTFLKSNKPDHWFKCERKLSDSFHEKSLFDCRCQLLLLLTIVSSI